MIKKLAFKNVGRSLKDYAIYFLTLVLGVCVFYLFNSIYDQRGMMETTEALDSAMESLKSVLTYISVFVAVILGFLIVYSNNFFIKRRKKELGIYLTLGMTKNKVSTILILETTIIALIALVVGIGVGVFGSQFMSVFTAKIFEVDMSQYKFVFSKSAAWLSVLYFGIIFVVVMLFNIVSVSRLKLIDLIYDGSKNERQRIKRRGTSLTIFVLSLVCLIGAYFLILWNGINSINLYFTMSIVLGSVGTILFFLSLAEILARIIKNNKKLYYRELNMFAFNQFNSKINTNFMSISVVCIILLLVIGIFSSGYSIQNALSDDINATAPYDYTLEKYANGKDGNEAVSMEKQVKKDILKGTKVAGISPAVQYINKDISIGSLLGKYEKNYKKNFTPIGFVKMSEYNKLAEISDKKPVNISKDEYMLISGNNMVNTINDDLIKNNVKMQIDNRQFDLSNKVCEIAMMNNDFFATVVVPDEVVENKGFEVYKTIVNINAGSKDALMSIKNSLDNYDEANAGGAKIYDAYRSKEGVATNSVTSKAIIAFFAIYIGMVFMITCAAILAIQQLSEAEDNKNRYALLKKLGAEKSMLNRSLFKQVFVYFALPLGLAMVHSVVGLTAVNNALIGTSTGGMAMNLGITAVFVLGVYGAYFLVTYLGSKSIINKN
ncbi:MAG: ABC transporter permease [Anaerovoracaceae bacterium]